MKNILVVDDEPLVLLLLKRVLSEAGYNVLGAESGEDLEVAASFAGRIHLLLTDLTMPGISGQQLSAALVQRRPDLQVIYMSGYCDRAAAGLNSLHGSVAFLQKPFGRPSLLAAIHEVLPPTISVGSIVLEDDTAATA